jgi:transcriptional regulator with XRE-family HTH domain
MTRAHDDIDKKFGVAIRLARIKHKLTQTQLAEALGVTHQQIQKYEKGANAVASTRIPDLCRILKTCPDDLFDFRSETTSHRCK